MNLREKLHVCLIPLGIACSQSQRGLSEALYTLLSSLIGDVVALLVLGSHHLGPHHV